MLLLLNVARDLSLLFVVWICLSCLEAESSAAAALRPVGRASRADPVKEGSHSRQNGPPFDSILFHNLKFSRLG